MNLENIQTVAWEACFSTNNQIKFKAEKLFMDFVFDLSIEHYPQILENFSQTVLFVFLSYLNKKLSSKEMDLFSTFFALQKHTKTWLKQSGHFIRLKDQQPLQKYIANTIGMVLGDCSKQMFLKDDSKKCLMDYFKQSAPKGESLYRLFLYRSFIDSVGTIGTNLPYVPYRSLVYAFQEQVIPLITEELYPFFLSLNETVKVNELNTMMPQLMVEGQSGDRNLHVVQSHDKIVSQMVFELLREIVCFKYNININEFEMETDFENCFVTFPEIVLVKIASSEFLEALYFMVERLIVIGFQQQIEIGRQNSVEQNGLDIKRQQVQHRNYLEVCFECLKKILISKTNSLGEKRKNNFIKSNFFGLRRIISVTEKYLQNCGNGNGFYSRTILPGNFRYFCLHEIFQSGYKFIHGTDCHEMAVAELNYLELIKPLAEIAIRTISSIKLTPDNKIYQSCCNILFKISIESISPTVEAYVPFFKELAHQFFFNFLQNYLASDPDLFSGSEVQKLADFQSVVTEYFQKVLSIASMNLCKSIDQLVGYVNSVFESKNESKIANYILLSTRFVQENYFERNIIYEPFNDLDLIGIGKIVFAIFEWVDSYKLQAQSDQRLKSQRIDLSVLLFFERILTECMQDLKGCDYEGEKSYSLTPQNELIISEDVDSNSELISIQSRTYKILNLFRKIPTRHEDFLMFCFNELINYLHGGDVLKIEYVLDVIYSISLKLKWSLNRKVFCESWIAANILKVCIEIGQNSLQNSLPLLAQRKRLYRLICVLNFDDALDNYKISIEMILESLHSEWASKHHAKILFDLSGLCEHMENPKIYRHFLHRLNLKIGIQTLLSTLYSEYGGSLQMLKEVIDLNRAMLSNHTLRMQDQKLSVLAYSIVSYSLPFIVKVLQNSNSEEWDEVLLETYTLARQILESTNINMYVVKKSHQSLVASFLIQLLDSLIVNMSWIKDFPELRQSYYGLCQGFCNKSVELIIRCEIISEGENNSALIRASLIKKLDRFLCHLMLLTTACMERLTHDNSDSGSQSTAMFESMSLNKAAQVLQTLLGCFISVFSLFWSRKGYLHNKAMVESVEFIMVDQQGTKINFLKSLFTAGLSNIKSYSSVFESLCKTIEIMGHFYGQHCDSILLSIGVSVEKIGYFEKIFKDIRNHGEDCTFVSNLKKWFQVSESLYEPQIEY